MAKKKHWATADKEFREWNENKFPIYKSNGEELILRPDEEFVPAFYPKKYEVPNRAYYVSNYGRVISFKKKTPLWLKPVENITNSYEKYNDNAYGHTLVWFSFAYRALKEGKSFPKLDYPEKIDSEEKLKDLIERGDYRVHHENLDPKKNLLSQLCLVQEDLHDKKIHDNNLHGLHQREMKGESEKAWDIAKNLDKGIQEGKGRVISIGEKKLITEQIDQEEILSCILSGINPDWLYYVQRMLMLAEKEYKNFFVNNKRIVHIKVNNKNNIFNIYTYEDLSFKLCSMNLDNIEPKVSYVAKVSEDTIYEYVLIDRGQNEQNL